MSDQKFFNVEMVTPRSQAFSGEAEMVALPGAVGPFQVLVNHAPILAQLTVGQIRIYDPDHKIQRFATSGGFIEMNHNKMTVIAESIEPADAIDVSRAEAAHNRALERMEQGRMDRSIGIDMVRAKAALDRAINRLKVAGKM